MATPLHTNTATNTLANASLIMRHALFVFPALLTVNLFRLTLIIFLLALFSYIFA
jgi:hypothetical protein